MRTAWLLALAGLISATAAAHQRPRDSSGIVKNLHDTMIKPASDLVFSVGRNAPKTLEEWTLVSHAGATLAAAGHLMLTSRTDDQVTWPSLSRRLTAAGRSARRSADARSVAALTRASDRLIVVCETCHAAYRNQRQPLSSPPLWNSPQRAK